MKKPKYAIAGTSCAGKTTLTYALVSRLKQYGILVDGVLNSDRRITFDPDLLNTQEHPQMWMVNNIIQKEIELSLQPDVDLIISDRSVLDLMAYYTYQYPNSPLRLALWGVMQEWIKTYDTIFVLDPLAYQDDQKRPSDEFRLNVDRTLRDMIGLNNWPNVEYIDRTQVLNRILKDIGFTKPKAKLTITPEEVQVVANALRVSIAVSSFESKDAASDYDMFVEAPWSEETTRQIKVMLGVHVPLDINYAPSIRNQVEAGFAVFLPESM
jgi:hypothetical protein